MASVTLRNVVKRYPGNPEPTVRGVDLEIADKEFVVLVGPSGCGKSTVLRMIAGLEEVTGGEICIGERRVNDLPCKERNIAMVFQSYALFPNLNVEGNIGFGLKVRGVPRKERSEAVRAAADIVGMSDLLHRKPAALSGGQRQRVAIARAIVRQPDVFLFDEPLSNLDAKLRGQMRTELIRLARRLKTTMVYVTHDQIEALTMADRIVVFHDGRIQQAGTPKQIYQRPANRFVAGFLGSPPMSFIDGRLEAGLFTAPGIPGIPLKAAERLQGDVTLGIRPEALHIAGAEPPDIAVSKMISGAVEVVEFHGAETSVTVRIGSGAVVLVLRGEAPEPGSEVGIVADLEKLHVFSAEQA
jgi:multiple sugar transport system ATP-binding protein